jgi:hypothetical protein
VGLVERLDDWANLEVALGNALRGKRTRRDAAAFVAGLPGSLEAVGERLRSGIGPLGRFREFTVWDPKRRVISAPCFADRVLHHALMNVCEPAFERWLVRQTFACRTGSGLSAALREAEHWSRCRKWYLKLDVRHYFETLPRDRLLARLERLFGEAAMLRLWERVVESFQPGAKAGIPIGSLTSQHLANFYLGFLDRRVKEGFRVRAYARYLDDIVLWHDDRDELRRCRDGIRDFAASELGLELKEPVLNRTDGGMEFLGFRLHPGWTGLGRRGRRRLTHRSRALREAWEEGCLTDEDVQRRMTACLAFVAPARSRPFRRLVFSSRGA